MRGKEAGPVVYKTFSHIEQAEAFIETRLKMGVKQGFLAFWTIAAESLSQAPPVAAAGLAVIVLIPDPKEARLVHPVAFDDLSAAREFLRQTSTDGVASNMPSVMWSLPIRISLDGDGVRLSPAIPADWSPRTLTATADAETREAFDAADLAAQPDDKEDERIASGAISEVRRVLNVRRWQDPDTGSFPGFGSPRGRF